jgi:fumarate hydratase class II
VAGTDPARSGELPISGTPLESAHIRALGQIKGACATVNAELGVLDKDMADAIAEASDAVASGAHDDQFPVDVFQTGSGTSSNMNANEVIATLATRALGRDVHPNDHVNASQSSNDVFPTSIHVAATEAATGELVPALDHLAAAFEAKAAELSQVVKSGRTHLMDATPVTLGQEFGGYAAQIRKGIVRVLASLPRWPRCRWAAPPSAPASTRRRASRSGSSSCSQRDRPADHRGRGPLRGARARDGLVEFSGQLRTIAVSLTKICNDLRWMGSGPRTGLSEIALPDLQPGSSIMPGKVNPVLPEATLMVCAQVIGNDATITVAAPPGRSS